MSYGITLLHVWPVNPVTGLEEIVRISGGKYITEPGDSVSPNTIYNARLIEKDLVWTEQIFEDKGKIGGRGGGGVGTIRVNNYDGFMNPFLTFRWKKVRFEIYFSETGGDLAGFDRIARGSITGLGFSGDVVSFTVRDNNTLLDEAYQTDRYDGLSDAAGEITGFEALEDEFEPRTLGKVRNVPGNLINPIDLTYAIDSDDVQDIPAVYDGVNPYPLDTSALTGAAFDVHVPASGKYSSDLTRGLFRLGTRAVKSVTADVEGRVVDSTYLDTTARIIEEIAASGKTPVQMGAGVINSINTAIPGEIGYFFPSGSGQSKRDALDALLAGQAAYYYVDENLKLQIEKITVPNQAKSVGTIGDAKGLDLQISDYQIEKVVPPITATEVQYRPRWETGELLNAPIQVVGLTAQNEQVQNQAETIRVVVDNTGVSSHWDDDPYELATYYWDRADAVACGDRFNALFSEVRFFLKVTVRFSSLIPLLGNTLIVTITDNANFSARPMLVMRRVMKHKSRKLEMTLWG